MDEFRYTGGELHCEELSAEAIAQATGTPTYVYSANTIRGHFQRFSRAFEALRPLVCYSVKSCSNLSVLKLLRSMGAGMDVVSGGEMHRAHEAGVPMADCVYAGVGKTDREIADAITRGLGWFNIESEEEFENVTRVARRVEKPCRGALRINPDVDPRTHRYTSTGKRESKFGVDLDRGRAFFEKYGKDQWCRLQGVHLHIGSPVYSVEPYVQAIQKALRFIDELERACLARITMLDLGGGFGADYQTEQSPTAEVYAREIVPLLEGRVKGGMQVIMEPGRSIVANAGILLTRVQYVKTSGEKRFVIVDAGMNVLLRPSHYGSFHFIWPARVTPGDAPPSRSEGLELPGTQVCDVVGPICESGDFLAVNRKLPVVKRGDLLAVFTAGAYGMTMASRYNSFPLPAEVLVDGTTARLIRRRETYSDLVAHELQNEKVVVGTAKAAAGIN